jgi:predicted kinase
MRSDAPACEPRRPWIADRLDVRLAQGRLDRAQIAGLAGALAAWHAEPAPASARAETLAARAADARARIAQRAPGLADAAAACEARLAAALRNAGPALGARAARRLHGRPRCEEIHVDPSGRARLGPPAAGAGGDPCEDLAALVVCAAGRRRPDAARELVDAYAEATGDFALHRALDAYVALAALESARRALEEGADPASALRALATPAALAAGAAPAFVIAVAGPLASGKSTLAGRLARAYGAPVVSADAARPTQASAQEPEAEDAVTYTEVLRRAAHVLAAGRPVVLDAGFPTRALRARVRAFAAEQGAPLVFVECRADASATRRRLEQRARREGVPAAHWLARRERLLATWEPLREVPRERHVLVDTTREGASCLPRVERALGHSARRPHRVRSRSLPHGVSARG